MSTKIAKSVTSADAQHDRLKSSRETVRSNSVSEGISGLVQQAFAMSGEIQPEALVTLQRKAGNQAVARLLARRRIQLKLIVGAANDAYEQEADRVAEQVMRMPAPEINPQNRNREEEVLRIKAVSASESFEPGADFASRLAATRGSGSSLSGPTLDFMQRRFCADFRDVRLHTGEDSGQLNRAIGAQAFTQGRDIYLANGKENIDSSAGRQLLAHEMVHIVQQSGGLLMRQETDLAEKKPEHFGKESIKLNNIIQRSLYDEVEDKKKNNRPVSDDEIIRAIREFINDLLEKQGYLYDEYEPGRDNPPISRDFEIFLSSDYQMGSGILVLPPRGSDENEHGIDYDIKNGRCKPALLHELGHRVKKVKNQPNAFQDIQRVVDNTVDWAVLESTYNGTAMEPMYPKGNMTQWKEEVRADLTGIRLQFEKYGKLPSDDECDEIGRMINIPAVSEGADLDHPPFRVRVKAMKDFVKVIEQQVAIEFWQEWSQRDAAYDFSYILAHR